jgi:PAS domain S-box-containing protein
LIAAEIARLEKRQLDAERLYELAIQGARKFGFVHNEAVASELAAKFYTARSLETIASAYLWNARSCYVRWGAEAKVHQIDILYPKLTASSTLQPSATANGIEPRHLDLTTVIEMSQAVSGEVVLDRLIKRLMITAIEHANATRCLLLLPRENELGIAAEATTTTEGVAVDLTQRAALADQLPISVLSYVLRVHDAVILDDALHISPHSADAYVLGKRPRSILCLPLVKQKKLVGVLYLENSLSSHVFTRDRTSILQLVASQAAIAIENAKLFLDIQITQEKRSRAEADFRHAFDMIPALAWSTAEDGTFAYANKQWYEYTGISHERALGGEWVSAFHPDDVRKVTDKWNELLNQGVAGEIEARMRRPDGSSRSFLMRAMPARDAEGNIVKWYGTNTDIDDLKREEAAQEALVRTSHLVALGELTASIAHEVNQPLSSISISASLCLRSLKNAADQPNIAEARKAAERIVKDSRRAADIVTSIRSLARRSPSQMTELDVRELIEEILPLLRAEIDRGGIVVRTELASNAAIIVADRTRVQQVLINLIKNGIEAMMAALPPRVLEIRSRQIDVGQVEIIVSDTGVGLDLAIGEKIFDTFFTMKPKGLGIGLSICRSIVESHGGRLWASANSPRGSAFHFTAPATPDGGYVAK